MTSDFGFPALPRGRYRVGMALKLPPRADVSVGLLISSGFSAKIPAVVRWIYAVAAVLVFDTLVELHASANFTEANFGFHRQIDPRYLPDDSRQWERVDESVFITDLSQAIPHDALTYGRRRLGKWKVLPFETAELSGNALSIYMNTEPPDVRIPVQANGWHAVYIGLSTTSGGISKATRNGVRVKISRDRVFRRMATELPLVHPRRDVVQEQFLDVSNLRSGDEIVISAMHNQPTTVVYIRIVPLTDGEVAGWQEDLAETRFRNSIFTFDGGGWIWPYEPRSVEHLQEAFRGMETSDAAKWWFEIGADQVYYPSEVGTFRFDGTEDYHKPLRKDHAESLRWLRDNGINPLQVARDAARAQGREFHIIMRPGAWAAGYPFEEIFASDFYNAHPEWRCMDYDGKSTMYMSYAVPEVRRHVVRMFREAVEMVNPEGVGFIFTRGMPMMLWEPAFCDEFKAVHGVDPRTLAQDDSRVYEVRARIMNKLMREIRAMLDEVAAERGVARYKMSHGTFSHHEGNRRFGFQLETWIREGMVDDIVVAVNAHFVRGPNGGIAPPDMSYYGDLVAGTDVGVYPLVLSVRTGSSADHVNRVLGYLEAGAHGIAVWDPVVEATAAGNPTRNWPNIYRGNTFDLLAYMGHRALLEYWRAHGYPEIQSHPIERLGDNTYSEWYPNSGY